MEAHGQPGSPLDPTCNHLNGFRRHTFVLQTCIQNAFNLRYKESGMPMHNSNLAVHRHARLLILQPEEKMYATLRPKTVTYGTLQMVRQILYIST